MNTDQSGELINDLYGAQASSNVDCQTFTYVFINDRQALEHLTIGTTVKDKIVGPYVMTLLW